MTILSNFDEIAPHRDRVYDVCAFNENYRPNKFKTGQKFAILFLAAAARGQLYGSVDSGWSGMVVS